MSKVMIAIVIMIAILAIGATVYTNYRKGPAALDLKGRVVCYGLESEKGFITFPKGYPGTGDTVYLGKFRYDVPLSGDTYIDTVGTDTLKIYLNSTWTSITP